jgi:hypothetical protein
MNKNSVGCPGSQRRIQLTGGFGSFAALNLGNRTAGDGTVLEVPLGES